MSNATKYLIVIGFLVVLGGAGVVGLRSVQSNVADSSATPAAVVAKASTQSPTTSPTANASPAAPSANLDTQNASLLQEGAHSPSDIQSANPTADPTPSDTSTSDSALANQ